MQINTVCLWEIDLDILHVIIIRKKNSYILVCTVEWAGLLAMENQNLFLAKSTHSLVTIRPSLASMLSCYQETGGRI